MNFTFKKTVLLFFMGVITSYGQNTDKEIDYLSKNQFFDINIPPKYSKNEIEKELNIILDEAKNNFSLHDSIVPAKFFKQEAALLHAICSYKMKNYKYQLISLSKKHHQLYDVEEKRRHDFLKANPGIRIKFQMNYHKIYQYIEQHILPCLEE